MRTYVIDLLTPAQLQTLAEIGETVAARLAAECREFASEVESSCPKSDAGSDESLVAPAAL